MNILKSFICILSLLFSLSTIAQTCNPSVVTNTPNSRYIMNANGTLIDKKTGLMWMRCALGQTWSNDSCSGSMTAMNWQSALQKSASTNFASFTDWRLPNIKELLSIVDSHCYDPAVNMVAFPNAAAYDFWSSSPVAYFDFSAWKINFFYAHSSDNSKDSALYVRLVRSGQ